MKSLKDEQDASLERLVAAMLNDRADAAGGDACLDADTVAAWADGALDARERADAEAHAADCARCQALLAAMITTQPEAVEAPSRWRLPALRWLAPLTVAAIALLIWIAVPARGPVPIASRAARVAPVDRDALPQSPPSSPPADAKTMARSDAPPPEPLGQRHTATAKSAAVPSSSDLAKREDGATLDKQAAPLRADALAAPAANANAAAAAPLPMAAPSASAARVASPAFAPSPSAAPVPPPAAATANVSAQAGVDTSAPREKAFAARASTLEPAAETIIVSSNPSTRFRLLRGGGVQRSTDGGVTWRTEVTGVTDTLTAGVSPSSPVCWLVGPSGIVLLSTDGRSWRRLPFPERVDLRAIAAVDQDTATVTTVDGRGFVTSDGGLTWRRAVPDF